MLPAVDIYPDTEVQRKALFTRLNSVPDIHRVSSVLAYSKIRPYGLDTS